MRLTTKMLLNSVGTLCVALGLLGALLPLLPATPFLLLASACYVRGSERLHRRLVNNPLLGPYLTAFAKGGGLPRRAKIYTLLLLWPSLLFSAHGSGSATAALLLFIIGLCVTLFIITRKTVATCKSAARS